MSGLSLRLPNLHQITASSWSVSHLLLQTKKSQEQDEESKNQENIWASKWSWSIVNNMSWMQIIRDISAILTYFNIFRSKMLLTSENSIFFLSTPWNSGLNPSSFLFLRAIRPSTLHAFRLSPLASSKYQFLSFCDSICSQILRSSLLA